MTSKSTKKSSVEPALREPNSQDARPSATAIGVHTPPIAATVQPRYTTQNGGTSEHGSQTQTLTMEIRQHLPTLIITLRDTHAEQIKGLSEKEQEAYVTRHVNAFRDMLIRNIDEFQAIVKSARPSAAAVNEPDYAERRQMYCELLRVATGLVANMQTTINEVLTRYRLFIEDLWDTICEGKDPLPITTAFQQETEAYMKQTWDPVFAKADKMMADIEKARVR
jgi:hypothetical protein